MHKKHLAALLAMTTLVACSKGEQPTPTTAPTVPQAQASTTSSAEDDHITEAAPWFGKTGLSDDTERELPRYLRREFGVPLSAPGALKAADLRYLGIYNEGTEKVHYWQIDGELSTPQFAYVVAWPDRTTMGWGDRRPAGR